jgi:hypothetical protein
LNNEYFTAAIKNITRVIVNMHARLSEDVAPYVLSIWRSDINQLVLSVSFFEAKPPDCSGNQPMVFCIINHHILGLIIGVNGGLPWYIFTAAETGRVI